MSVIIKKIESESLTENDNHNSITGVSFEPVSKSVDEIFEEISSDIEESRYVVKLATNIINVILTVVEKQISNSLPVEGSLNFCKINLVSSSRHNNNMEPILSASHFSLPDYYVNYLNNSIKVPGLIITVTRSSVYFYDNRDALRKKLDNFLCKGKIIIESDAPRADINASELFQRLEFVEKTLREYVPAYSHINVAEYILDMIRTSVSNKLSKNGLPEGYVKISQFPWSYVLNAVKLINGRQYGNRINIEVSLSGESGLLSSLGSSSKSCKSDDYFSIKYVITDNKYNASESDDKNYTSRAGPISSGGMCTIQ